MAKGYANVYSGNQRMNGEPLELTAATRLMVTLIGKPNLWLEYVIEQPVEVHLADGI